MRTIDMENAIFRHLSDMRTYICFEVQMPTDLRQKKERVDCLTYQRDKKEWRCYELKASKSDFHSKNSHSFHGHFNYFVVPGTLYPEIKEEIPDGIGCFVVEERSGILAVKSIKKAKKQVPTFSDFKMKESLLTALNHQHRKRFFAMRGLREL